MRTALAAVIGLFACVNAYHAYAWSYIIVDKNGQERVFAAPPMDLTYPPRDAPMPLMDASKRAPPQGALLAPEQEQRRENEEMLIITDIPILRPAGSWMLASGAQDALANGNTRVQQHAEFVGR